MTVRTDTAGDGTGFVLVHHARSPAFPPLPLLQPVTYLGRVAGNDVVLNSPNVSRRHAKLIVTDLGVTAHDLDSHNGIFLNGTKVRSTPVTIGDLLYVGDICVELQRGGVTPFDTGSHTAVVHTEISDEEDPRSRSLAATLRVAHLVADGDDEAWAPETVQICRELVEASVAAFVEIHADGELDAPIILQPDTARRGAAAVQWPLVHRVIETGDVVFSRDVVQDGFADENALGEEQLRAVIAMPVFVNGDGTRTLNAIIYLASAQAGSVFSELELETLQAIARLVAMRLERQLRPAEFVDAAIADNDDVLLAAQQQITALNQQLTIEQDELHQLTARLHGVESDNLKLRQQAELDRSAAVKKDAERERDLLTRIEQATFEGRRLGQRDAASAGRDQQQQLEEQSQQLQELVDVACAERDALLEQTEGLRTAAENARSDFEAIRTDLDATHLELDAVRAEYDSARQEAAQLRIVVAGFEANDTAAVDRQRAEAADTEVARLRAEVAEIIAERGRLLAEVARLEQSETELQERATQDARRVAENQALASHQTDVLRQALRTSVLPTVVDHIEAVAAGEATTTSATTRSITAVYLALSDFDAWCERANADVVRSHLDRFCATVAARTHANGGRIEQVVGHGHFLSFGADPAGARAAVRCALEVAAVVDTDSADATLPGVVGGLHLGTSVVGFFGDAEAVSSIQAGLPVVIARAAVDFAPRGNAGARGVVVSEAVRAVLAGDVGFRVTRLDPSWIRGVNAPVQLALVDLDDDTRGAP